VPATFVESEAQAFFDAAAPGSFDVVFMSYGALIWIADLARLLRGIAAALAPGWSPGDARLSSSGVELR
jgi:hypothetical protein